MNYLAAGAQEVHVSAGNQKVAGLIPAPPKLSGEVSLSKVPHPDCSLTSWLPGVNVCE